MPEQSTNRVLMIRPTAFGFNPETAESNTFQQNLAIANASQQAVVEFDRFVEMLRQAGVIVEVVTDTEEPAKPDAVFPNNWVSFHEGGRAVIYPMANPSRQAEVRLDVVRSLGYEISLNLRQNAHGRALEGTGSIVLDRAANLGYACLSPRTDTLLLDSFSQAMGIRIVRFHATAAGAAIYHTNVVMAVGEQTVIACLEVASEPEPLATEIAGTGKALLNIGKGQMASFAGNLLQLKGSTGPIWAMSQTALHAFTPEQRSRLEAEGEIVAADITTIETLGGGSARCMIAELF